MCTDFPFATSQCKEEKKAEQSGVPYGLGIKASKSKLKMCPLSMLSGVKAESKGKG